MAKNNDVVLIELDRPRELRYGHKALKKLTALTGIQVDNMDLENFDLAEIEKVIYCGLTSEDKDLELEQMEDILDQAPSYQHIIDKMQEAFTAAFGGQIETDPKNLKRIVEEQQVTKK